VYKYENFDFEDEPDTQDDERGELGNPIDDGVATVTYERGPITAQWRTHYLDEMRLLENEDSDELEDPFKVDEVFYHDVQLRYRWEQMFGGDLTLYGGALNLTDEEPPEYLSGVGEDSGIYDVFGRTVYVGLTYQMGGAQ
jgi:outer membrane receptor protein involved in Fe transport